MKNPKVQGGANGVFADPLHHAVGVAAENVESLMNSRLLHLSRCSVATCSDEACSTATPALPPLGGRQVERCSRQQRNENPTQCKTRKTMGRRPDIHGVSVLIHPRGKCRDPSRRLSHLSDPSAARKSDDCRDPSRCLAEQKITLRDVQVKLDRGDSRSVAAPVTESDVLPIIDVTAEPVPADQAHDETPGDDEPTDW
jgi:hypothetical protein